MAIRWRDKDEELLKKKVRNNNRKLKNLEQKDDLKFDKGYLPDKLNFNKLREKITTRQEFNDLLKMVDAFTKRGSENNITKNKKGAIVPHFLEIEKKLKLKHINKNRRNKKNDLINSLPQDRGVVQKGKLEDYDLNVHKIKDKHYSFKNKSNKEILKFKQSLKEYDMTVAEMNKQYRKNLYKAIEASYTIEQANKIKNVLNAISDQDLVDQYYLDVNLQIDFNYEELEEIKGKNTKFEETLAGWNRVLDQKLGKEAYKKQVTRNRTRTNISRPN